MSLGCKCSVLPQFLCFWPCYIISNFTLLKCNNGWHDPTITLTFIYTFICFNRIQLMRWIYIWVHWAIGMLMFIVLHQALLCQKPTLVTTNQIWTDDWYSEPKRFKFRLKGAQMCSETKVTSSSVDLKSIISEILQCLDWTEGLHRHDGWTPSLNEPHQYNDLSLWGSYSNDCCFEKISSASFKLPHMF